MQRRSGLGQCSFFGRRRLLGGPTGDVRVELGSGDRVYASARDGTPEELTISVARGR